MRELPMLFSAPMVRAIREGRKTQTRRIVKSQPPSDERIMVGHFHPTEIYRGEEVPGTETYGAFTSDGVWALRCPHGEPGDRLWVREAFHVTNGAQRWEDGTVLYRADHGIDIGGSYVDCAKWKPSIHMPREFSRITLEIDCVRIERLNDISANDCMTEGIELFSGNKFHPPGLNALDDAIYRDTFIKLWESLNGHNSWNANPWVWVIEFRRVDHIADAGKAIADHIPESGKMVSGKGE